MAFNFGNRFVHSKLITVTKAMLAMMVLALNIMRNPDSRRNKLDAEVCTARYVEMEPTDLFPELLMAISLHAENEYTSAGQSQNFIEGKEKYYFVINLTQYLQAVRILRGYVRLQVQATE